MNLDPTKHARLESFLAALPERHARELLNACAAAEARGEAGLPYAMMREALNRRAGSVLDYAFGAARPLVSGAYSEKQPGRIDPASLDIALDVAEELAPEAFAKVAAASPPLNARRHALGCALRRALRDECQQAAVQSRIGARAYADLNELIALLCAEPELSDGLSALPGRIHDLDNRTVNRMRGLHDTVVAKDEEAGLLVLFLFMERLAKQAQILRVLKKMTGQDDDLVATQTDVAAVGDRLLDEAEIAVHQMVAPVHAAPDGDGVVDALARFAAISRGMTREFGIRREGSWGMRLKELRTQAARNMEALCVAAPDAVSAALPQERVRLEGDVPATRPAVSAPPRAETMARGAAFARILGGARDYASSGAFVAAHSKAWEAAERTLDDYCDGLIDVLNDADPQLRAGAEPWLAAAESMTRDLVDDRAADVLRRRAASAAAAAAANEAQAQAQARVA